MDKLHTAALIAVMALVTLGLRALPFTLLQGRKQLPRSLLHLGRVLPSAALGMLVVYCLRDLHFSAPETGVYQLLALALVAAIQLWKKNTILSIVAGTGFYMLLLKL